ncbi:MAG: hypothetical protein ACYCW6_22945, partial [Candidatus Xenobia bacterium]
RGRAEVAARPPPKPAPRPMVDSTPALEEVHAQGHQEQSDGTDPIERYDEVDADPGWPVDAPFPDD